MKHWKTNEEMGSGFEFTEQKHKLNQYNVLIKVKPYEKNLMRTFYLIRDTWTNKQLKELKNFLDEEIVNRYE